MPDQTSQLIAELCTEAGMLMEDMQPDILSIASLEEHERTARLDELATACASIVTLVEAARVLNGRTKP